MDQYKDFAFVYDELMNEVDYESWVSYIEKIIKDENIKVKNILELACGTGNITIPLAKKGYDIAGIDISEEMLMIAREKSQKKGIDLVLLNQDIADLDFDLYDLDCVLCACDGFNYILEDDDLKIIFDKIYKLLKEKGIFIFDISSYYKLSSILGNNVYGENRDDIAYLWQNYFDEEDDIVQMDLAFFTKEDESGKFIRFEETHYQRAYKNEDIFNMLNNSGFSNIKQYRDFTFEKDNGEEERVFFVCIK
ncbi:MAG TPA: class I SAM-dependent methyltransferase [Peptostreptococcaceae bacterium]|nr:class I SAM-dependent methyltransferase [Peptostreptococcaceae bacterium]